MKEITFKAVIRYVLLESILILLFAWIPSGFSSLLTALSIFVAVVAPICGILAQHWESRKLAVVYQLSFPGILYAGALRVWDAALGLSWGFLLVSLGGLVCAGALPYMKKRFSGILYREQMEPRTRIGQLIMRLAIALFPIAGAAGAALGLQGGQEFMQSRASMLFLVLLLYLPPLQLTFIVMFHHANDLFLWNTRTD